MKIKRVIDGHEMEFELTEAELTEAYCTQQKQYDIEDTRFFMADKIDATDDVVAFGRLTVPLETYRQYMNDDEAVKDIAEAAREYIDDEDTISEIRWECYNYAISKYFEEVANRITTP